MASERLTAKQRLFVNEYLVDLNGTQAAIRAGYSEKTANVIASEVLAKPYIQSEIERLVQERERRTKLTADFVLSTIQETIERCKQGEEITDKDGRKLGIWQFEPLAVLKGCELAGKHLRLFTEKLEIEGSLKHEYVDVSRLTDEQLAQLERIVESASPTQSPQP